MAITLPFSAGSSSAQMNTFIKLALWLAIAAIAANLLITLYYDYSTYTSSTPVEPTKNAQTPNSRPPMVAGEIASLNLLGVLGAATTSNTSRELPQTRLQLELVGAFTNTESSKASALIASKGSSSKRYFVTETLPGGAKLHSVAADSVTLDRGGNLEVLRFPKSTSSGSITVSRSSSARSNTTRNSSVYGNGTPRSRYGTGSRNNSRMR